MGYCGPPQILCLLRFFSNPHQGIGNHDGWRVGVDLGCRHCHHWVSTVEYFSFHLFQTHQSVAKEIRFPSSECFRCFPEQHPEIHFPSFLSWEAASYVHTVIGYYHPQSELCISTALCAISTHSFKEICILYVILYRGHFWSVFFSAGILSAN